MDNRFTSVDQLPMFLSIPQASKLLNISKAKLYQLARNRSGGFPVLQLGERRMVVPRDQLFEWIDKQIKR